jgi:hypothetical protein
LCKQPLFFDAGQPGTRRVQVCREQGEQRRGKGGLAGFHMIQIICVVLLKVDNPA